MTKLLPILCLAIFFASCNVKVEDTKEKKLPLAGTWQLVSGTIIEKQDTSVTMYDSAQRMIKIINEDHFSFLKHDVNKGKDSVAIFDAGGGRYTLSGDQYTEYLDYCSYREWEGHVFPFTVSISGDTLIQSGIEKLEDQGVDRMIIEKYVRVKKADSY